MKWHVQIHQQLLNNIHYYRITQLKFNKILNHTFKYLCMNIIHEDIDVYILCCNHIMLWI